VATCSGCKAAQICNGLYTVLCFTQVRTSRCQTTAHSVVAKLLPNSMHFRFFISLIHPFSVPFSFTSFLLVTSFIVFSFTNPGLNAVNRIRVLSTVLIRTLTCTFLLKVILGSTVEKNTGLSRLAGKSMFDIKHTAAC
jgi:hypothetical protein